MAYIETIQYEESQGPLREIYDDLIQSRGKLAQVHTAQSLNPKTIVQHIDLYMGIMFGKSPLKRAQREMVATVVSAANECNYCQVHHGTALNNFWKDQARVDALRADIYSAGLDEIDTMLCEYAYQLTKEPGAAASHESMVTEMKAAGITDRMILDLNLVTSYFNFANRIVMGLGIPLEAEGAEGYDYD